MVKVVSYAKRTYSSADVDGLSFPGTCSFTPINRHTSLPSDSTSVDRADPTAIQEDGPPKSRSKATARGKKRAARHQSAPSVTVKKPRRVSQPRNPKKSEKASDWVNREISQASVPSPSIDADFKASKRDDQEEAVPVQAANVGATGFPQTMRKLDAFRNQAGEQIGYRECQSHSCQDVSRDQCIVVAESTSELVGADAMEIHKGLTDQDGKSHKRFKQECGSEQPRHEYSLKLTYPQETDPEIVPDPRSHKSTHGMEWPTASGGLSPTEGVGDQNHCIDTTGSSVAEKPFPEVALAALSRKLYIPGRMESNVLGKTMDCQEDDDIHASLIRKEELHWTNIGTANPGLD
ncbi:MAG: hypothetical protein Q9187_005460 [Circinaria calcarea]